MTRTTLSAPGAPPMGGANAKNTSNENELPATHLPSYSGRHINRELAMSYVEAGERLGDVLLTVGKAIEALPRHIGRLTRSVIPFRPRAE